MLCRRHGRHLRRIFWLGVAGCVTVTLALSLDLLPVGDLRSRLGGSERRPVAAATQEVFTEDQAEAEARMAARTDHLAKVCRKHRLGLWEEPGVYPDITYPPSPQYSVFYFNRKYRLGYCPLYKSGSTTWLYNFAILGGYTEQQIKRSRQQISHISRQVTPELRFDGARQALNDSFLFLVVRHPFERLLSAYRDKLENIRAGLQHGTEHFYQRYGRRIVDKYRHGNRAALGRGWDALGVLGEVVKRVAFKPGDDDDDKVPPLGIEPTFGEFVQYLLDTDLASYSDDHWIPYYLYCTPCSVRYHAVAKFETLRLDHQHILQAAGVDHLIEAKWRHLTRGRPTRAVAQSYFSTITRQQAVQLYGKYKFDFELFEYSPDEYYQMTVQS